MSIEVRKNETNRLYEALIEGEVVGNLAYEFSGDRVSLTHSFVDPDRRGQGVGSSLARFALEDLQGNDQEVSIYCAFVADYIKDHPESQGRLRIHRSPFIATRLSRDAR